MRRIIAARQDGLCSRLGAILNAMYISKKTGKDFYYYWPESEEQMKLWENIKNKNNFRSIECELEKNIFSKNFIQNYSLGDTFQNPGLPYGLKQPQFSFKASLDELALRNEDCFISHVPCYSYIEDIDKEEYYREMKAFWRQVEFTSKIQEIIQTAKAKADKLDNFIAIHVRIADVALNQAYKNTGYFVYKFSPLELVFELIKQEIQDYNIVLFSDDFDGIKILKNYCLENNFKKVYLIDEFIKINLNSETERAFFELAFMICAKKIYTGDSNFSKFASRVGLGREATYISEVFSNQERYDLIFKNKNNKLELKPLQEAYKFLYLYTRGKLIKRSWVELEQILVQALALDPFNNLYKIGILECLLNQKNYMHAEEYTKKIIKDNNFLKDLLHPMMIFKDSFFKILSSVDNQYENLYLLYLTMSKKFNLKIK
ncbi:sugar transferase, partial [Campylobacter sp. RM10543]|uniref:sugar transferase n=1 Tax=Campylobacter molothri TaxID=1032242 RepID=UPI00301B7C64|nr:sugar transferase [Campylobacter sp. RM10543]